jgi:nicotinamide-nucleotide amidase
MNPRKLVLSLLKKNLTLSVAESCTGGLVCHKLTSINGASRVLKEGIICYSNSSKIKRLNIPERVIKRYGAVSEKVCRLMANNITKSEATDIGLSITGIAGPTGDTPEKKKGLVYIGINNRDKIIVKKYNFSGKRTEIQRKSAVKALQLLRRIVAK